MFRGGFVFKLSSVICHRLTKGTVPIVRFSDNNNARLSSNNLGLLGKKAGLFLFTFFEK